MTSQSKYHLAKIKSPKLIQLFTKYVNTISEQTSFLNMEDFITNPMTVYWYVALKDTENQR